jgi:SAM-dependent methyltransferase
MDIAAIKQRQQAAWPSGDYAAVGTRLLLTAELLCEAVDLPAGQHVLDVACGNGNAALAAARRFCQVTGIDYVPALLERARRRARRRPPSCCGSAGRAGGDDGGDGPALRRLRRRHPGPADGLPGGCHREAGDAVAAGPPRDGGRPMATMATPLGATFVQALAARDHAR